MRPIHLAHMDKTRPVVVLTREAVRPYIGRLTVAPITSTIRGLSTEVAVGAVNGLDHDSVISLDNVATISRDVLGRRIGYLQPKQEAELAEAIIAAYDLDL